VRRFSRASETGGPRASGSSVIEATNVLWEERRRLGRHLHARAWLVGSADLVPGDQEGLRRDCCGGRRVEDPESTGRAPWSPQSTDGGLVWIVSTSAAAPAASRNEAVLAKRVQWHTGEQQTRPRGPPLGTFRAGGGRARILSSCPGVPRGAPAGEATRVAASHGTSGRGWLSEPHTGSAELGPPAGVKQIQQSVLEHMRDSRRRGSASRAGV